MFPKALPVSLNKGEAGINDPQCFVIASIHFRNFNISGIYRLGDLIPLRMFMTCFLSVIYLCKMGFGAVGLQKGHLFVHLEK